MSLPTRGVRTLQSALCTALFWATIASRHAAAERAAGPPLQLLCAAELPFTREDLAAALALRIADSAAAGYTAAVRAAGDGMVEVSLGERQRAVYLGERRGSSAARWVALAVIDLIAQEAAPPLPAGDTRSPSLPPRAIFLFYPVIGLGASENPLQASGGLGGSLRIYSGLRWTIDVSYGGSPKARLHEVEVDLQELPLRSGPAYRWQRLPLEVRLSAVVVPYWLRAAAAVVGLALAVANIDEIIRIIRKSEGKADAAQAIMARFQLDDEQTDAILELKIYRLARLEILIIRKELDEKRRRAREINTLLLELNTHYSEMGQKATTDFDEMRAILMNFAVLASLSWERHCRNITCALKNGARAP